MPEAVADLARRIGTIEDKLDALATAVARGFERVSSGFAQVDQRFEQVDQRFDRVDQRFEQVDQRFERVNGQFETVSESFAEQRRYIEFVGDQVNRKWDARFQRVERKLDQFIDRQTETNTDLKRRVTLLEERKP